METPGQKTTRESEKIEHLERQLLIVEDDQELQKMYGAMFDHLIGPF